jgi:hypothetical protein
MRKAIWAINGALMHGECRSSTVSHECTRMPQCPRAATTTATFQAGHAGSILVTHSESPRQRAFVLTLSCASISSRTRALRGPLVLGPPTNPLSPSFRRCFGSFNWPPAGTTSWPLTRIPCHLNDPENANRSGSDNTRRIPLIVCAGEPYITGLKCSIAQRTVGKQSGCNVRDGRATGNGTASSRSTSESRTQPRGPADRRGATRAGCSAGGAGSVA